MLRPAVAVDADDVLARCQQLDDVGIVRAIGRCEPRRVDHHVGFQREYLGHVAGGDDAGPLPAGKLACVLAGLVAP